MYCNLMDDYTLFSLFATKHVSIYKLKRRFSSFKFHDFFSSSMRFSAEQIEVSNRKTKKNVDMFHTSNWTPFSSIYMSTILKISLFNSKEEQFSLQLILVMVNVHVDLFLLANLHVS